jgi:EF hand domain-containing protein
MKLNWLVGCSAAALLLTSGIAFAQQLQFSDFDTNADKNLSIEEYSTGLDQTKLYVMYDTNGDGNIDEAEFKAGTDMGFKADMDAKKFDQARFGDWVKWDKNADGKLDRSEFNAGMYSYYNNDADPAMMNEAEFGAGATMYVK